MRSLFLLVALFGFLVACSHSPSSTKREPQTLNNVENEKGKRWIEFRNLGEFFYKRGDYLRAIPYLEAFILFSDSSSDLDPRNYFILGYSYLSIGEVVKAKEVFQKAVRRSPYQPLGYQFLGLAFLVQGKPKIAAENFRRGLEFDSHPPKMHYYLGLAHKKMGDQQEQDKEFQKAEEEYEKILLSNVYDFGANFELAYLYLTVGHKITKVEELIENAKIGLKDSDPEVLEGGTLFLQFYLPMIEGIEAFRKNDTEKATVFLMQAALSAPLGSKADLAEIYRYRGASEREAGRIEESQKFMKLREALDPMGMTK